MDESTFIWTRKYNRSQENIEAWRSGVGNKVLEHLAVKPKSLRQLAKETGYSEGTLKICMSNIRDKIHLVQSGLGFQYELKEKRW